MLKNSAARDFTFCGALAGDINNSCNVLGALLGTPGSHLLCFAFPFLACILTDFFSFLNVSGRDMESLFLLHLMYYFYYSNIQRPGPCSVGQCINTK